MSAKRDRNIDLDAAVAEVERRYSADNPRSRQRFEAATRAMPGGNTRTVLFYTPFPATMVKGEGAELWDLDGHRYRDFLGEYTAGLYGHSNPRIIAAVKAALDAGIVLGAPNRYEVELAELIRERFPSCERIRFTNSGTEANLMALGAARGHTGRTKVMVFDGGYHGGVLYFSHGGSPVNAPYPLVVGRYNDMERTLALIESEAADLAAILIEPMMGGGGCIAAEPSFLSALREAADRHDIVLIFDEVMTSRLSPGGLQERLDITPDLTSFGKYLGGGMSFGAFGGRADIMDRFDPRRADAFPHAGTFNNNVLTMAAGAVGLKEIFTPAAAVSLNARGDDLRTRLNERASGRGLPVQATGIGSIMCIHCTDRQIRRPEDTESAPAQAATLIHLDMMNRGFYFARRGFIALSMALTETDIDDFVAAFDGFLEEWGSVLD